MIIGTCFDVRLTAGSTGLSCFESLSSSGPVVRRKLTSSRVDDIVVGDSSLGFRERLSISISRNRHTYNRSNSLRSERYFDSLARAH